MKRFLLFIFLKLLAFNLQAQNGQVVEAEISDIYKLNNREIVIKYNFVGSSQEKDYVVEIWARIKYKVRSKVFIEEIELNKAAVSGANQFQPLLGGDKIKRLIIWDTKLEENILVSQFQGSTDQLIIDVYPICNSKQWRRLSRRLDGKDKRLDRLKKRRNRLKGRGRDTRKIDEKINRRENQTNEKRISFTKKLSKKC